VALAPATNASGWFRFFLCLTGGQVLPALDFPSTGCHCGFHFPAAAATATEAATAAVAATAAAAATAASTG